MSFWDEGSRVNPPVVFSTPEKIGMRKLIGFGREPVLDIEIVQHAPAKELQAYRDAMRQRSKGEL